MDLKSELLKNLDDGREQMLAVIEKVDENQQIYPLWKIKEIVAHITGWDDSILTGLGSHTTGGVPAALAARGIDVYNAATVTERENLSYEQIMREFKATRELVKQAIRDLPEDKLTQTMIYPWGGEGTIKTFINIFAEHEKEHALEIKEIIK